MNNQGLHLRDIHVQRHGKTLLHLDLRVRPGEVTTLMGSSGSGKSTLIAAIAGFLPAGFTCSGRIELSGEPINAIPPEQRHVGVLFQDPLLFPHLSVMQNMLFALPPGGTRAQRHDKVAGLLGPVGLMELADRDPATLSGGQQARVALMRVLAAEPKALLLDEPFSKLDAPLRDSVRQFVFGRARTLGLPTLLVTHDVQDAAAAGGDIVHLD